MLTNKATYSFATMLAVAASGAVIPGMRAAPLPDLMDPFPPPANAKVMRDVARGDSPVRVANRRSKKRRGW